MENLVTPLLLKPAISGLELIHFIRDVKEEQELIQEPPRAFKGLEVMRNEVSVTLKEGMNPSAQCVPRRIVSARKKSMHRLHLPT